MEGQDFNPTPAPTPAPEPTPMPDPAPTVEPVPQDSFAEPAANTGASWQPQQATAPQVGGMNIPPAMTQTPAEAPKKKTGLIVGIAVAAVVIIGLVVAIIVMAMNNGGSNGSDSGEKKGGSMSKEEELKMQQRNIQREDDIARILTAVNDYQTNNSGKTPFGDGTYDKTTIAQFVRRYIESDLDIDGVEEGKSLRCDPGKSSSKYACDEFSDPDGTLYGFTVDLAESDAEGVPIAYKNMDHIVHVYVNASCGDKEGTYDSGTGNRQIAMFYVGEGGKIFCEDNH